MNAPFIPNVESRILRQELGELGYDRLARLVEYFILNHHGPDLAPLEFFDQAMKATNK